MLVGNNRYQKETIFISVKWYQLAQPIPITSYQPIRKIVFIVVLYKGVPKDNFYESSCDSHRSLQTYSFLTP
jgi:hypothetical protein